jgi:hypothetical protein
MGAYGTAALTGSEVSREYCKLRDLWATMQLTSVVRYADSTLPHHAGGMGRLLRRARWRRRRER